MQKIGPDPLFHVEGGITYGVSRERMPETKRAEVRLRRAGRELCRALAAAFHEAGSLTSDESNQIVAQAEALPGRGSAGGADQRPRRGGGSVGRGTKNGPR